MFQHPCQCILLLTLKMFDLFNIGAEQSAWEMEVLPCGFSIPPLAYSFCREWSELASLLATPESAVQKTRPGVGVSRPLDESGNFLANCYQSLFRTPYTIWESSNCRSRALGVHRDVGVFSLISCQIFSLQKPVFLKWAVCQLLGSLLSSPHPHLPFSKHHPAPRRRKACFPSSLQANYDCSALPAWPGPNKGKDVRRSSCRGRESPLAKQRTSVTNTGANSL